MLDDAGKNAQSVLVLEDDVDNLRSMEGALAAAGVSVEASSTFEEFKRKYSDRTDLIVFNLLLPDADCIDILRFLAENRCSAALVLMTSADERITRAVVNLANAHDLNIAGTLTKPFDPRTVSRFLSAIDVRDAGGVESTQVLVSNRAMRQKIQNRTLRVVYQPKVRLSTGEVDSVEALVRWPEVKRSQVSTPSLIYVAEKANLIDPLTVQVLERSLAQLSSWRDAGVDVRLSVNISPRSLNNAGFVSQILAVTDNFSVPASKIVFEVTEKAFSSNMISSLENLSRLGLRGFGVSIDDFGTGHSSFERLNLVPFSELKLDKSFVLGMQNDPQSFEIVRAALELGNRLGVEVVAEGVEDFEVWNELKRLGCDFAQGFVISPGVEGDAFVDWMAEWRAGEAERSGTGAG